MEASETARRVESNSEQMVNARNRRQIEANVAYFAQRLDQIEERLEELDQEWDVERSLETNASILALFGLGLGIFWKKALVLPMVVTAFLLQHAIQGWCPPLPIMRRLGIRTMHEINKERYALKALRGDFEGLGEEQEQGDSLEKAAKATEAADLH